MVSPKCFCINFAEKSKYFCCTAKHITYCCPYSGCLSLAFSAFHTWVFDTFFRLYLSTKAAVIPHHHVFATAQYYYHSCVIWVFVPWVLLSPWPLQYSNYETSKWPKIWDFLPLKSALPHANSLYVFLRSSPSPSALSQLISDWFSSLSFFKSTWKTIKGSARGCLHETLTEKMWAYSCG